MFLIPLEVLSRELSSRQNIESIKSSVTITRLKRSIRQYMTLLEIN